MSGEAPRSGSGRTGSTGNPKPVEDLIDQFERLPGIGRRSAERMAFHLLKLPAKDAEALANSILAVKKHVRHCGICFNLTDADPCRICTSAERDASCILVVEQPKDLINLEQTGVFRGVYHILMGRIDPLHGIGEDDITLRHLLERIDEPARNSRGVVVREVILGLNPDLEGDTTALYLTDQLRKRKVNVTRLARGLPSGSQLEFASRAVLADAIEGRQSMKQ